MERPESRSRLAVGMQWAAGATTIGMEFVLPVYLGSVADRWWKTGPWLTIVGVLLGFAVGMIHVVQFARRKPRD